jgi:carboxypeptidase family protein/TonB-dependent receptor-like protein
MASASREEFPLTCRYLSTAIRVAQIAIYAALYAAILHGQTTQGVISGRLLNSVTGRPVAGASLVCSSGDASGAATVSDASGYYYLPLLSPGSYRVRATVAGFQSQEVQELELRVASRIELDFRLRPLTDIWEAGQYNSVFLPGSRTSVTFFGPDIDSSRTGSFEAQEGRFGTLESTISEVIDPQQIQELPLTNRDVYNSLVLLPAVNADTTTARGIGVSVNGQRPSASNFLLDGLENNNYLISGPLTVVTPEAVEEYRVSINNFSAEYGRTAGYLANAVTKAGTSQWHGVVYFNLQNEALDSNDFSRNAAGLGRGSSKQDQPGFQAGGPILRGRLFTSTALDYSRSHGQDVPLSFYLPSAQYVAGLKNLPNSEAGQLLTQYAPPPVISPNPVTELVVPVTMTPPIDADQVVGLERIDYVTRDGADHLTGRVAVSRVTRPDFVWSPYPGFSTTFLENAASVALAYVRTLAPSLTNELRGGMSESLIQFDRPHPEIPTLNVPTDNGLGFVFLPGSLSAYSYRNHSRNWELVDDLVWARGRHLWKFGGSLLLRGLDGYLTLGRDGEVSFANFTSFDFDQPLEVTAGLSQQEFASSNGQDRVIPNYNRSYRYDQFDLFFQDSFRVTDRLTVNYGVRYERFGAPVNVGTVKDVLVALGPGATLPQQLKGAQMYYPSGGDEQLYSSGSGDFAPRIGLAYSPFRQQSTVLRAAYGIFYDRPFDNLWQNIANNNFTLVDFPLSGVEPLQYLKPLGQLVNQLSNPAIDQNFTYLTLYQPGIRDGYIHSYFAGVQQRVTGNFMLEVNALGSYGRRLIVTDIVNRDFSVPGITDAIASRYQPDLPQIYERSDQGFSNYNAMTALARYRTDRAQFQIAYTWSHSIDNQSEALAGEYFNFQFINPESASAPPRSTFSQQFDSQGDRGNSDFDQRQSLVFSGIWQFPRFFARGETAPIFRGWRVSTIGAIRSGLPYSVLGADYPYNTDLLDVRASLNGSAAAMIDAPAPGGRLLLNSSAFVPAPAGQIGNTGRNAFTGPGFFDTDISLARSFPLRWIGEAGRLTVRADAFNVLNHANLGNPNSVLGSPDFGLATFGRQESSTGEPAVFPLRETARQIQLLFRIGF